MRIGILLILGLLTTLGAAGADMKFPILQAGSEVYSNVTVTTVTATDIYFIHARGGGNAKLKNLSPALQKQFGYNAAKADEAQKAQWEANARFRNGDLRTNANSNAKPPANPRLTAQASQAEVVDIPVPEIHAKSVLGQRPPKFVVEKWLTAEPKTAGKFVLIDFWATWCGPCRGSIPELNRFHLQFSDKLTVIGVSDELEADVRRMKSPKIEYAVAVDVQARMHNELQIRGIPHCIIIDPKGIVRFEGHPGYLNDRIMEAIFAKYGK